MRKVLLTVIVIGALLCPLLSMAEPPGKGGRLIFSNTFSFRSTPMGLGDQMDLAYRYYLTNSKSILFNNDNIAVGLSENISPASNAAGVFLEVEPIAILKIRAQYELINYFGAFNAIVRFNDKNDDYSDSALDDIDKEQIKSASGVHYFVRPTFQIQLGRFIMLNTASFEWFDVYKDYNFYYEPTNDTLIETDDYLFSNMAVVGVAVWQVNDNKRVILGARHSYLRVESTARERQQLDGVCVWMIDEKKWGLEKPTLMMVAGGFLDDRYREQQMFGAAVFSFNYTLSPKK